MAKFMQRFFYYVAVTELLLCQYCPVHFLPSLIYIVIQIQQHLSWRW